MPCASSADNEARITERLEIFNASRGLGIKVAGGKTKEENFGIFIKRIIGGGVVSSFKDVNVGDQIISVNGTSLVGASNARAVNTLRLASASDYLTMTISSDTRAVEEYARLVAWNETKAEKKLRMSINKGDETSNNLNSSSEESLIGRPQDIEKRINIKKSSAGIGFRVQLTDHEISSDKQASVLRIASISRGGDTDEDGRLSVGDYLIQMNDHDVTGYNADQVHSLLLREKLRPEQNFQVTYVPADVPLLQVFDIYDYSKMKSHHMTTPLSSNDPTSPLPPPNNRSQGNSSLQESWSNHTNGKEVGRNPVKSPHINSSPDSSFLSSSHSSGSTRSSQRSRRFSLDGDARIKVDKLHSAMEYFGVVPTSEELDSMNQKLVKDENDAVQYSDFVEVMLDVFGTKMKSTPVQLHNNLVEVQPVYGNIQCNITDERYSQDLEDLRERIRMLEDENKSLREELSRLKDEQNIKDESYETAKKETQEEIQHMKYDYDELIRVLETEIATLHSSELSLAKIESESELQKQLSLTECECRKLNQIRQGNEDTIEGLLAFLNKVVQSDVKSFVRLNKSHEAIKTLEDLAREAEQIYIHARLNMKEEDLPFGWEEASLSDGRNYFIDHITHATSWVDPRKASPTNDEPRQTSTAVEEKGEGSSSNKSPPNDRSLSSSTPTSQSSSPAVFRAKMRLI